MQTGRRLQTRRGVAGRLKARFSGIVPTIDAALLRRIPHVMNSPNEPSASAPRQPGLRVRRAIAVVLPTALALAAALVVRHWVVEPAALAHFCDPQPWQSWCAARTALIMGFVHQRIGWLALVLGILAFATSRRSLGQLALVTGALGLVLYSYEPSAIGALLGALALVRSGRPSVRASA